MWSILSCNANSFCDCHYCYYLGYTRKWILHYLFALHRYPYYLKKKNYKKLKIKIYDSKSIILNGQCNIYVNNSLSKTIFQSIRSIYNLQFHSSINNNELWNAKYWLTVIKYRVSVAPFLIRIRKWMTISNLWVTKITQHMT